MAEKRVTRMENGDIPLSPLVKKSRGVKIDYVANKNGKLLWDESVPKNVRDQWQSIYDNKAEREKTAVKHEAAPKTEPKTEPKKEETAKGPGVTTASGGIPSSWFTSKGVHPNFVADEEGNLLWDESIPQSVRDNWQEIYDLEQTGTHKKIPDRIQRIIDKDPNQMKLFNEIRSEKNGKLIFPKGLDPAIGKFAQRQQSNARDQDTYNRNLFPSQGQSWEQYQQEYERKGPHWYHGPLAHLLPESVRDFVTNTVEGSKDALLGTEGKQLEDIQLLTPEQRALQNQAISQAGQQLGQVGRPPTLPNPPTLTPPGPVPELNFNFPGYQQPQTAVPGYTALAPLAQKNIDIGALEDLARHQFKTQTVPSLAARFSGLGAQNSSAYQGALGAAGRDLDRYLSAQRVQHEERQQQQRFAELARQNEQQLALQNYMNQLAVGQNAQQLQREELQNQLAMGTNTQRLAQQGQGAQQGLQYGQLQANLYGTQVPNVLEQQRQGAQGTLSLLQQGLQPRTQPVYEQGSPGLLQTGAQALAQQLPGIAARYATGGAFGI